MSAENRGAGLDWRRRLRYAFDCLVARGVVGQIVLLSIVSLVFYVVLVGVTLLLAWTYSGGADSSFVVKVLGRTFQLILVPDPVDPEEGTLLFVSGVAAILGGLFIGGTLIGILSGAIDSKMEQLRRGRSFVAEIGHTVILGWSSMIFRIVGELVIANENHPGQCITILADEDPVGMEEEILSRVGDLRGTRLVCRRGNPVVVQDLEITNLAYARSCIILAPEGAAEPDNHSLKILLTAAHLVSGRRDASGMNVVLQMNEVANNRLCAIIAERERVEVSVVNPSVLVPRILTQACRKRGLSDVYLELFDYEGDEIYFVPLEPMFVGRTFRDTAMHYPDSTIIGIWSRRDGLVVNPAPERVLEAGDELVSISEDDDTTVPGAFEEEWIDDEAVLSPVESPAAALRAMDGRGERNVIIGWTPMIGAVLLELDGYLDADSCVVLVNDVEDAGERLRLQLAGRELKASVEFRKGDPTDPEFLRTLDWRSFDHVLVLPHLRDDWMDEEDVDAATIKTLLYIREILSEEGAGSLVTSQMLVRENMLMAARSRLGDFVVSDEIIGRIMAQLSEQPRLRYVFDELLTTKGNEIYMVSPKRYVRCDRRLNGYTLAEACFRHGHVFVGYVLDGRIRINPPKESRVKLNEDDRIIVVAEHMEGGGGGLDRGGRRVI